MRLFHPPPACAIPSVFQLASSLPQVSKFAAALSAGGLAHVLEGAGPFTLFVPTNAAMDAANLTSQWDPANDGQLEAWLSYFIIPEETQSENFTASTLIKTLSGQRLAVHLEVAGGMFLNLGTDNAHVQAHHVARNGVVHIIDHVLSAPAPPSSMNVAQLVFSNPRLSVLSAAIKRADVVGPLSDESPLTLLAPTDAAWAKLDPAFLESLLAPENRAQLLQLLSNHVLPGRIAVHDVVTGASVPTLHNGAKASFASHFGEVTVNGHARLVWGDTAGANGLIHEIDHVLIPSLVADYFQLAQYI